MVSCQKIRSQPAHTTRSRGRSRVAWRRQTRAYRSGLYLAVVMSGRRLSIRWCDTSPQKRPPCLKRLSGSSVLSNASSPRKSCVGTGRSSDHWGLIESDGEQLILTGDGSTYLERPSASALLEQMRDQIAGIDEMIGLLTNGMATMSELRAYLNDRLGVEWETDAQVRFRLGWLTILGVVQLEGNRYSLDPGSASRLRAD